MTEYHPPMTGLETHFEEELGQTEEEHEARTELRESPKAQRPRESQKSKAVEEAMHLGR